MSQVTTLGFFLWGYRQFLKQLADSIQCYKRVVVEMFAHLLLALNQVFIGTTPAITLNAQTHTLADNLR